MYFSAHCHYRALPRLSLRPREIVYLYATTRAYLCDFLWFWALYLGCVSASLKVERMWIQRAWSLSICTINCTKFDDVVRCDLVLAPLSISSHHSLLLLYKYFNSQSYCCTVLMAFHLPYITCMVFLAPAFTWLNNRENCISSIILAQFVVWFLVQLRIILFLFWQTVGLNLALYCKTNVFYKVCLSLFILCMYAECCWLFTHLVSSWQHWITAEGWKCCQKDSTRCRHFPHKDWGRCQEMGQYIGLWLHSEIPIYL